MVELEITEISPPTLMGLKINKSTLVEKKVTIEEVANLLRITEKYVIGYDETFSESGNPHYHIHFIYNGKADTIQHYKRRVLKAYGTSTKMYQAKDKKESNPYTWLGYATKENRIFVSQDLDPQQLALEEHTQLEFKKSKLKYGKKIEDKKKVKLTFEEKLFQQADKIYIKGFGFIDIAKHISRISLEELESFLTISRVEYYTWKYLLTRKHITHLQYLQINEDKYNRYNI
jgi:hypothetical protein